MSIAFRSRFPSDPAALARRIADRHTGVGGDGLIFICPSEVAAARMRMFNADGSEAEMCGNGVRCVAKYVYDHGIRVEPRLQIETGAGVLTLDLEVAATARSRACGSTWGSRFSSRPRYPCTLPGGDPQAKIVNVPLGRRSSCSTSTAGSAQCGLDPRMTCVSMGNPHAVLYCRDVAAVPLEIVGPRLETHAVFPRRINVHFVQVHSPREVTMRTWERGSGITLACGTGASAVCVAGSLAGQTDRAIVAHLPGGDWTGVGRRRPCLYDRRRPTEVFSAEWPY